MILERKWSMPSKNTFSMKPIREFLEEEITEGIWLDPFSNNARLATITNDLNPNTKADYHMEAKEFLQMYDDNSVDGVLFDPPYSPRQIKECYESVGLDTQKGLLTRSNFYSEAKDEIARIIKPGGKAICFGWNSQGIGENRGFKMQKVLFVPHGGHHNDTICTSEIKERHQFKLEL